MIVKSQADSIPAVEISTTLAIAGLHLTDGYRYGDVLHLATPAPLRPQTIQENMRKLTHRRLLAVLPDLLAGLQVRSLTVAADTGVP
jgi:hypothetical protein